jgi:threonine dehydrogenase-like Zn-dependent dehydrogenase
MNATATLSAPATAAPAAFTLPATMAAIAFTGREQAALMDWPLNQAPLQADEVRGRTLATLASPGTELNFYAAEREKPTLSGYAAVFAVEEVGSAVTDLAVGTRCLVMGSHAARQRDRRANFVPLPAGLDPRIAVFARLVGVTWSTLVTTTARPGDRVLVTGLGPVGNLAAQIFSAAGYVVTAVDPVPGRRALAEQCGLSDVRADIGPAASGDGYQLAVECSGHEAAVIGCCQQVRKRGEVAMVGVPWRKRSDASAHELLNIIFHRYVVLRSGWEWEVPTQAREFAVGSIFANFAAALRWLESGRIRTEGLATVAHPAEAQRVWQDLLHQRGAAPTAIFDWQALG